MAVCFLPGSDQDQVVYNVMMGMVVKVVMMEMMFLMMLMMVVMVLAGF